MLTRGSQLRLIVGLGLATAASATNPATALAYRTGADLPELPDDAIVRWQGDEVVLELLESDQPGLPLSELRAALDDAFARWSQQRCAALPHLRLVTSREPAKAEDGRSTVQWLRGTALDEYGLDAELPAITDVAYVRTSSGWQIAEADVSLNAASFERMLGATSDGLDPVGVLTHELGHVLGLLHPCELERTSGAPWCGSSSTFEKAVMHPVHDASRIEPAADDRAGLCSLYPDGSQPASGPRDAGTSVDAAVPPRADASVIDACEGAACRGERRFGDPCESGAECSTGLCFMRGAESVCTRTCGTEAACPSGWSCAAVDGTDICQPVVAPSGCSAAGDAPQAAWWLVAAALLLRRRRTQA